MAEHTLSEFRGLEFHEQIARLGEIEAGEDLAALDGLFELYEEPVGDAAVDTMVRNTLRTLLLVSDAEVLKYLGSERPKVRDFAQAIAGEKRLKRAAPLLLTRYKEAKADPDAFLDLLTAMSRIGADEFLAVFRLHAGDAEPLVASLCLEMLGVYGDEDSLPTLTQAVNAGEEDERYHTCDLVTWKAIESLSRIAVEAESGRAVAYLVEKIHHRNPTARRLIHESLTRIGQPTVHYLGALLTEGDEDHAIMAANVLGFIGAEAREGLPSLEMIFTKGQATENVRFAAYEALGRIGGERALSRLTAAFVEETDEMLLMTLAHGLEEQAVTLGETDQAAAERLAEALALAARRAEAETRQAMARALAAAKAKHLFLNLHAQAGEGRALAEAILAEASALGEPEVLATFTAVAEAVGIAHGVAEPTGAATGGPRLLAIDDSDAMLHFYRSAGARLGYVVSTAVNGKEGLDLLDDPFRPDDEPGFALIIVDMNMPVMDGIEFTENARKLPGCEDLPILMASTESGRSQAQLARRAGVTSFLKKPFTLDVLKNKINKLTTP